MVERNRRKYQSSRKLKMSQEKSMENQSNAQEEIAENPKSELCKNCGHPFAEQDQYCGKCAQKRHLHLSVGDLMHEFMHTTLHLDGKFFKMLHHLFIPGRITNDFISGKRKTYPHPVRFFLVTTALFLLAIFKTVAPSFGNGMEDSIYKSRFKGVYPDALGPTISYAARFEEFFRDSVSIAHSIIPEKQQDSLFKHIFSFERDSSIKAFFKDNDSTGVSFSFSSQVPMRDIFVTHPDSLIKKYQLDESTLLSRFSTVQFLKATQSPSTFFKKYIGNFAVTFVFVILVQALVLKLLYIRRKRLYVEHILFLMNIGTAMMLSMIVLFLVHLLPVFHPIFSYLGFAWFVAFLYFNYKSMRAVFGQSRSKTLLKFGVYSISYFFIALFMMVLGLFGTALLSS
jgi:Protein of unknown function (DUF3667)